MLTFQHNQILLLYEYRCTLNYLELYSIYFVSRISIVKHMLMSNKTDVNGRNSDESN